MTADPPARLQHAREQLELLRSYGTDGGQRGAQARAEIDAAEAELDASAGAGASAEAIGTAEPAARTRSRRGKED